MAVWLRRGVGLVLAGVLLAAAGLVFPVRAHAAEPPPEISAEAYVVMDAATGQVLLAKNPHLAEYPASITKILTMAMVLDYVDIDTAAAEPITCSEAAAAALIYRATMIALVPGEVATLKDLLYATQIESANDAANVLSEYISGSIDGFAQLMNERVRQLGLSGSHFVNPSGQPHPEHATTAYDMAAITRWALSVNGFRELFGATEYSMAPTNKREAGREFHNSNLIMVPQSGYYCEGVTGSKSGYTDDALYTLVTTAERGGTELICVVLKNPFNADKYTNTTALLDYCFANFSRVSYPVQDAGAVAVPVYGGGQQPLGEIEVYGSGEAGFMLHNSLGLGDVVVDNSVPESYVIGQDFAPQAVLSLPDNPFQYGGQLASVPLNWSGLEDIIAANTTPGLALARMAEERPVLFWLLLIVPVLALLVIGRILYVRWRRKKRRQQKLEAVRSQLPVRIAPRPAPAARKSVSRPVVVAGRERRPELRVVSRVETVAQPRRVGQAR